MSYLVIMYNILAELLMVSECLQNRKTILVHAYKIIKREIAFFEYCTLKRILALKSFWPQELQIKGNFYSVPITSNNTITVIYNQHLLSSVSNNFDRRLFTTRSSNEPSKGLEITKTNILLLSELQVLKSKNWPPETSVRYGKKEIG